MDTTTLTNFWQGYTSTTIETIFGNTSFFGMIFVIAISLMIVGGLFFVIVLAFKNIIKGSGKGRK